VNENPNDGWQAVCIWAGVFAFVFLALGVLGFIPGITTHYSEMAFSRNSHAQLFGVFETSVLQNILHLLFGLVGLAMAFNAWAARAFLLNGGAIYLALFFYGLIIHDNPNNDFFSFNGADNWLTLLLAVGMIASALFTESRYTTPDQRYRSYPY
jgi:hypothetical protein